MTLTRRGAFAGVIGAAGALAAARATAQPAGGGKDWSGLDAMAAKVVADGLTPGLTLAFARRGEILFSRAYGSANLETATPATTRNIWKIGSVTKQYTGAAFLLLQEDGKLSVDDKLSRFLPDFPLADTVTLRQMLTHTSGLGNYTNKPSLRAFLQDARRDYDRAELLAEMKTTNPMKRFEPGEAWAYSNTAYVLLGLVIETASGMPWAEFMKTRLFDPLGLSNTAVDDAADIVPGRVSGYSAKPKGGWKNCSFISMTYPGAAGAIRSTPEDMCRWHAALLGGKALKPESLKTMLTPGRTSKGELPISLTGKDKTPVRYGFGLNIGEADGRTIVSHGGGIQGFSSSLHSIVDTGFTVAMVVNCDGQPEGPDRLGPALREIRMQADKVSLA
ncbi:serine hydrolase domain-containing protein [Caulobacter mirabilis]|uniref:Serine hydrolase n=1 Tax=Caulobacter mirabilis TaxID=69666 RepID=A0A2D2AV63_9CAUL|nr:serine hydrolase domain-containing protein [Caulobacter mirabilis]ATQ41899.1 serine hydrolase [Caulobacter mirabilis]